MRMADEPKILHDQYLERPSYRFLRTVGIGSAGKSRLWMNDVLGRQVVSKTISLFGLPGGVARSEPRILEGIEHPRLVRVREAQWAPGHDPSLKVVTFTTDFCEGLSVAAALAAGHMFSVGDALTITADLLDALAYLHEDQRLIHRDVNPFNVMLDGPRRRGFLGDLGSAAEREGDGMVPAGGCTPLYQAPESHVGRIGVTADLYGAGMVLSDMLNGPPRFEELDYDRIDKRLAEGRRSLPDRYFAPAPWVPTNVASIFRSLTARDELRRPDTAAQALHNVRNARCVDWRRTDGAGLVGRWQGHWPPHLTAARRRLHEVTAEPIEAGRHKGRVRLRAA
jgi:eukaryotic-like serine/threonine-protein kinase